MMFKTMSIAYNYLVTFLLIVGLPVLEILFILNNFYIDMLRKNATETYWANHGANRGQFGK